MASPQRIARVREEVRKEASDILRKMKDPRLGFVTVTGADVSPDLRHVKIYVSVYGDDAETERTMAALLSATGFVRTELGQRIRLRYTPEVVFKLDNSARHGARIEELLADLHRPQEES